MKRIPVVDQFEKEHMVILEDGSGIDSGYLAEVGRVPSLPTPYLSDGRELTRNGKLGWKTLDEPQLFLTPKESPADS